MNNIKRAVKLYQKDRSEYSNKKTIIQTIARKLLKV